ncbi:hypothetical protein [Thiomicrorhabdus sp. 6S3-12]|uniref:hypothetical protein n=1 Tax=Thiomicrorhabdus sp. 6S3-12 TaxID=2819681 RepID=UPI001AAE10A0|nr:hypothetical protein [Thiomicrorhabdus sp. 6S3-12]MBO1924859.1 hypothetical protein [Thiomicrorhabdus sp. 6S3-12]
MCGGVEFHWDGNNQKVYFPYPNAKLPVIRRDGGIELVTWGRRNEENDPDALPFPVNGWVREDSYARGDSMWNRYRSKPVRIAVDAFMEKDDKGNSHWFSMPDGQCLQGLLLIVDGKWRVYVMTITPPENAIPKIANDNHDLFGAIETEPVQIHQRWPMHTSI